jgi:hypothetical protein
MASAASLNATATIINGQGLYTNANILADISTYRNLGTIKLLSNIYTNAIIDANVASVIVPIINTAGNTGLINGQFLLDRYPSNVTPISSAAAAWAINTTYPIGSLITNGGILYETIGPVTDAHTFANVAINVKSPSFSTVLLAQANGAFGSGMAGFAQVFTTVYGYINQVLDTLGSISMLKGKKYNQSGIGYNGITDLVTGGIGHRAPLMSQVVSGWGTMYNIEKINLLGDPYVFGQNLLDHGLGSYGNLEAKLSATGLDTTDITRIPPTVTTTIQQPATLTTSTFVGAVDLPTVQSVSTTNLVTGNRPSVIFSIYETITGSDLAAIVSATGFTSTNENLKTLADYLNYTKVVNTTLVAQLSGLGINNFTDLGNYITNKISNRQFISWKDLADFLSSITVPNIKHLTTSASDPVLHTDTITTLTNNIGTGSGPFGNPVILDYLGAASGTPYTTDFNTILSNYPVVSPTVYTAMQALDRAVTDTYTLYYSTATYDGNGNVSYGPADPTYVTSNVAKVNNALAALSGTAGLTLSQQAYFEMLNHLNSEVTNLSKAGAGFGPGTSSYLLGFAQGVPGYAGKDISGFGAEAFFANLITDDASGDTIRAAVAEGNNSGLIPTTNGSALNDPNPRMAITQSITQNIPLSTYISQNK